MKRTFVQIVAIALALLAFTIGGAYTLPRQMVVECQIAIEAPTEKVFAIVGDLERFHEFSPWTGDDLGLHYTLEGPGTGVGQRVSWRSDDPQVDSGSQTTIDYRPNEHLAMTLNFRDWRDALVSIDLEPVGAGAKVTWLFKSGLHNPLERWLALLFNRRRVGRDCEVGLAKLKAVAEK